MDDKKKQVDNGEGSFLNKGKAAGAWLISPYIFSKRNMNPFEGVSALREKTLESSRRIEELKEKRLKDAKERLETEGFEAIRAKAMLVLKKRRLFTIGLLVVWLLISRFTTWMQIFPNGFMNSSLNFIYTMVFVGMVFLNDYQFICFKHRKIGMGFWQYVRCRLGGK